MDYKSNNLKLVDLDQAKGIVRHYWSSFGNLDSDEDIIVRGAYARTILERGPGSDHPRIKFLWQHLRGELRGIPTELVEDVKGLLATTQVTLGRPNREGEDLLILYSADVITEHSVGIDVMKRDEFDRRKILENRLWEGSAVTWGANPLTPLVEMKEANLTGWIDDQIVRSEKAMNSGVSDRMAREFEVFRDLLKSYRTQLDPVKQVEEPTNTHEVGNDLLTLKALNLELKSRLQCLN